MSKTALPELPNVPNKKQRTGVGTSVANVDKRETDQFILALSQIKVERLQPKTRKIVTCERGDTLPVVFKKLVDNNVLAVPVLNQKGDYYGMVETFDIVRFVTEMFQDITNTAMIDLERLFQSDAKFNNAVVTDIMQWPLNKTNPFRPVNKGFSLYSAWEVLALSNARRVPVIDQEGHVADVVTQSMLIDFLWQNIEKIGNLAEKKISDLQSSHAPPVIVDGSSKAIIAFREMVRREIDHVAIVDSAGKLIDNLSLRDLRGIRPDVKVFYRLWSSVVEYKSKVREEYPEKTPVGVLHVLPTDNLYTVIELMAVKHVHHIFVVDSYEKMKPVRVISQADVMREVLGRN